VSGGASDPSDAPPLDLELLDGFRFVCRDDCGLCCYAEPRVRPEEQRRLLSIEPSTRFAGEGPERFLAARPDGGACQFLRDRRCGVHEARPSPCQQFPITVHVGGRFQASLVLSCPGLDLGVLALGHDLTPGRPIGLDGEIRAARQRMSPASYRLQEEATRRRARIRRGLDRAGRWMEEEQVRNRLRGSSVRLEPPDFPVEDPPSAEEGLDRLPLFYAGTTGPLALASGLGAWELLELRPEGGVERMLDAVPPPTSVPSVDAAGRRVLEGYLDYWLRRDALFGHVHLEMLESDDGTVEEWVAEELRTIAALTLARAYVRARASRATTGSLTADDVLDGIRATDQDLLDRPSWGDRW
jgi:Fe-S-cluster containining protein